jgi:hypothetical protein
MSRSELGEQDKRGDWIPAISNERLAELGARIKPVIRFATGERGLFQDRHGVAYFIEDVDPRRTAFTWDPKPTTPAEDLRTVTEVITYHTWAYYGFFKPSIAEVLAQIPGELVDRVTAFEIVQAPETAADLNIDKKAFDAGLHVATTRLYATVETAPTEQS